MDVGRIVKIVVVIAIAFALWKYGLPWIQRQGSGADKTASSDRSCIRSAERASEVWGSGLRQFVNPPYDLAAWSTFRGEVESHIRSAESDCGCAAPSCARAKDAMRDLRSLVADLDSTLRNNADPSGFVQRQEAIDNQINEASALAATEKD